MDVNYQTDTMNQMVRLLANGDQTQFNADLRKAVGGLKNAELVVMSAIAQGLAASIKSTSDKTPPSWCRSSLAMLPYTTFF